MTNPNPSLARPTNPSYSPDLWLGLGLADLLG